MFPLEKYSLRKMMFSLEFKKTYVICKNILEKIQSKTKTLNMLHIIMRFCISGSFFNSSDRHGNQNQNELGNFSQETGETEKATQNLPTNLLAILVPGVLCGAARFTVNLVTAPETCRVEDSF